MPGPQASAYEAVDSGSTFALRWYTPLAGVGSGRVEAFPSGRLESFDVDYDDVAGWRLQLDVDLSRNLWFYVAVDDRRLHADAPDDAYYIRKTFSYAGGICWSPCESGVQPYLQFGGSALAPYDLDGPSVLGVIDDGDRLTSFDSGRAQLGLDLGAGVRVELWRRLSLDLNVTHTIPLTSASNIIGHEREVSLTVLQVGLGVVF